MEINITIDPDFAEEVSADELERIACETLRLEGAGDAVEMGLVITGQAEIQALNRQYRGKDRPTDVIAFYMTDGDADDGFVVPPDGLRHLGEVVISYPQAIIQAVEVGHSVPREVMVLVIHGVLHLLGYDDETPEAKPVMVAREQAILAAIEGAPG